MSSINIKEPSIIKSVFSADEHAFLKQFLQEYPKNQMRWEPDFGRYLLNHDILNEYSNKLIPLAREVFENDTLLPSYSLFSHYEKTASLIRHKDNNACTYTLDLCVYQNEPWALGVKHNGIDVEYTLQENEALAYYGNDQEHWRGPFPNPESQHVAMVFFHYVDKDHWWYSKNPDYLRVVRNQISEEEWNRLYL